jgi:hypothetical protein
MRKSPRLLESAATPLRTSVPIVTSDQRGFTAEPNKISWPLGSIMFVSHITLSAVRPPLPATLTRLPTATSSAVSPKRLTVLTEFDSMSQTRSTPSAPVPRILKRTCGLTHATSVITPSASMMGPSRW